ncbi:hypothetical protein [Falsarthrobacter nasiphocae]|uniref:DUF8083 domain-containing protein n=1 Tax=Falsarthrobacter nasiphocae TaxID=189863 RepID=A0AAE4C519_9MICC|nr:hypothetical protein [Falsarthrobacter nasiphocae]MDR6891891.1 hypothetical protein [Falsarthrobacter nasiphocae]
MTPGARRTYSVVRLYVPAESFPGATLIDAISTGLDHDALEAEAVRQELPELLKSASERRADRLSRPTVYRAIIENQRVYVSPEQPEARIPETARALVDSVGELLFASLVSRESIEEAADALNDDESGLARFPTARYMWAGSACVPISWLIMFADEAAPAVSPPGVLRVDVGTALSRLRSAITAIGGAALPTAILRELSLTESWLTPHAEGFVELDYGAAAWIIGTDDSPRDLGVIVEALFDGDTATAALAYRRFAARWAGVRSAVLEMNTSETTD